MMFQGKIPVDLHGMNKYQAKVKIDSVLNRANASVYQIELIHGYNFGTTLRELVREEYQNHPKVKQVKPGTNSGITLLILREF